MGLIKSIFGEINHFIIDFICRCLINSICNTSGNSLRFISINKVLALFFHDRGLLFGHCTAHQVASAQSITCQVTNDLHNLFLIDNTPISRLQDWLQLRAVVTDGIRTVFAPDILRDKIHGARAVKRNSCDHIFQTLRLQFLHEIFHSRTFKLKYTIRTTGAEGIQNLFIIIIDFLHVQSHSCILLDQLYCILDHSQGTKSQEVHFQKSQLFQCCHGKLCDNGTIRRSGKRYIFRNIFLTDNHTGSMHGSMSWKSLQTSCHIDQIMNFILLFICFFQLRVHSKGFIYSNI